MIARLDCVSLFALMMQAQKKEGKIFLQSSAIDDKNKINLKFMSGWLRSSVLSVKVKLMKFLTGSLTFASQNGMCREDLDLSEAFGAVSVEKLENVVW